MRSHKYIPTFVILLFIVFTAVAQQENSDAVYLRQVKEYTLNKDGSWSYHYSHQLKLNTYFAFHTLYGEDFIVYNPAFQKLKINQSVTTMADGTKVISPENAYNELLPGYAANAPAYNNIREMAVTHTGLERGAIIDFDYTLTSTKGYSPAMCGNEALWMNSPVNQLTFIIHIPKGTDLSYEQYNIAANPLVKKDATGTTFTWNLANLPAATREDFRLKEQQNRPRIVFSTARTGSAFFEALLAQNAFLLKADDNINTRVKAVKEEKINDLAVALRLQDLVVNEINYQPVPLAAAGFRVRPATEVYTSNGGSETEKAVLLASMLLAAGIPAEVVAVLPDRYYSKKSCNILLAERFLVKAGPADSEPWYFSPLQNDLQDQAFTLGGKRILLLTPGRSPKTETFKMTGNEISFTGNFELSDSMDIAGTVTLGLSNRVNPSFKLKQDSVYAKKLLAGIFESSEIKEYALDRQNREGCKVHYRVCASGKVKEKEGHFFLKLPSLSNGVEGWHMTEQVSARTEALEIPFPIDEIYNYSILLPKGYDVITPEASFTLEKDFGTMTVKIAEEGRTLQIIRSIHLAKQVIDIAEYADFRQMMNTWNNKKYREIIFRKGPK